MWLRRVLLTAAYVTAVVVVPPSIGAFNYYNKAAVPARSMEAPVYSGALPSPHKPDQNKKIAVVLTNVCGAEITDTLPPFEILSRSGIFNGVFSRARARRNTAYARSCSRTVGPGLRAPQGTGCRAI